LTSTDVVDTALSYVLKQANNLIREGLVEFIEVLKARAIEHKHTVMMGRTHGVHAEPTTFGLKLALWYEEMKRNLERFDEAASRLAYGKLSGAVGTYANIDPKVEAHVCEKLGLLPAPLSTQTLQRDRHAEFMSVLALIATSIEKFATEIRGSQKTETREVEEFFRKGQTGSSAMPHKRNAVSSENMTGMARVVRGYMMTAYENVSLWHERDISHSSAERIILPDSTIAVDYMLNRFKNVVKNLTVFPENMARNMEKTYGVIFSQHVLLTLIDKGMSREDAYSVVQPLAMQAWEEGIQFKILLQESTAVMDVLTEDELSACFETTYHLKNVDMIFNRLGLA